MGYLASEPASQLAGEFASEGRDAPIQHPRAGHVNNI